MQVNKLWAVISCWSLLWAAGGALSCASSDQIFITIDAGQESDQGVKNDYTQWPDTFQNNCEPGQDKDKDTIPDELDGCEEDTDGDQIPNYLDTDSDGDGIPDMVEVGPDPQNPLDTDGDQTPDFKDTDSDADNVGDGSEDLNGDGLLGCCLTACGEVREGCTVSLPHGCGTGQTCEAGTCQPAVDFLCSDGESDPRQKTTFPGGKTDDLLPTFVCHKPGELSAQGLKPMQFIKGKTAQWHLALEQISNYGEVVISAPMLQEAAASFDLTDTPQAVAGFIVAVPTAGTDVGALATQMITAITTLLPGLETGYQLVSGSQKISHDGFPTVVGTRIAVTLNTDKNPPAVRNEILPLLLSRAPSELSHLPSPNFGPSSKKLIIMLQTLLRPQEGELIVMGGVAAESMAIDETKNTAFHLDDLSNGTGLATEADKDTVECDPFLLTYNPVADIIWVVDESESMDDNREDIVSNASDFFARASKSGLDFRMGVVSMEPPSGSSILGKFCSAISTDKEHKGGDDRFLLPTEQSIFESCIRNPPYLDTASEFGLANAWEAVTRHLPRAPGSDGDLTKIRKEATLVIILVTDEAPQEMKTWSGWNGKVGFLDSLFSPDIDINVCTSPKQAQINAFVADWITLYQGKNPTRGAEAEAIVHLIGGVCKHSCGGYLIGPEYPWGYQEITQATGGQMADICQQNLGTTLQLIIDSIAGASSKTVLQYIPISASLAVAINTDQIPRSRVQGFDYITASNSLVFSGLSFSTGDQMVASYRRWVKQEGPIQ